MPKYNGKTAIVTGASSGIGEATVLKLASADYKVYGTSRRDQQSGGRPFEMLSLDVTSDDSVQKLVAEVMAKAGRIDLVVNNAGFGVTGAAEESSIAQVKSLFDTNVFGTVRVTNAVLPIMRGQGSGRILNLSSGLGFIPAPYNAYYSATKHALEGYSESLDHEVREFGIRVLLIEPGATKSSFEGSTVLADTPLPAYKASRTKYNAAWARSMTTADTPESVADTILLAAQQQQPRLRYASGKQATQGAFARRFLPRAFFDKSLHKQFGLGS